MLVSTEHHAKRRCLRSSEGAGADTCSQDCHSRVAHLHQHSVLSWVEGQSAGACRAGGGQEWDKVSHKPQRGGQP